MPARTALENNSADTVLCSNPPRQTLQHFRRWIQDRGPALLVCVAFILFGARLFRLIYHFAVNIFFWDQWDLRDATLFEKHSLWQMFVWQHGPHRQGLGALLEKLVEPLFAWSSRTESFVVGGVVTVAALCAIWLKRRLYGRLSATDVIIPAVFFVPGQFATLFLYANFAHGPLPLFLVVLYCLAWTCSSPPVRYALVLVINFLAIYTGFGLLLGFLTPLLLILEYLSLSPDLRPRRAYVGGTVAISLASLASFFAGYRFDSSLDCFSPQPAAPKDYVQYVALMLANFFGREHGTGFLTLAVGILTIAALFVASSVCVWKLLRKPSLSTDQERSLVTVCLTSYCLLFGFATAYGRICSGLETAHASRYMIYLELGVLGLYFQLLNIVHNATRRTLVGALLVAVCAASWQIDRSEVASLPIAKWQWKNCYLSTGKIDYCNAVAGFPIYPDASRTHLQEKLDFLKKNHLNLFANSK